MAQLVHFAMCSIMRQEIQESIESFEKLTGIKINLLDFIPETEYYNKVQLTASLEDVMPINLKEIFKAGGWEVIEVDGHDFNEMWEKLKQANMVKGKPVVSNISRSSVAK